MPFLPDIWVFLQFAGAAIVLIFIPGPDMAFFIGRTISYGRPAGLIGIAGCCTGIFIQVLLVALGLSALIVASPAAFSMLKMAGALYLLWLAIQAVRNTSSFQIKNGKPIAPPLKAHYFSGIAINLLNPKVILFNVAFLPQFVNAADPHASGKILFLGLCFIPISLPFTLTMVFTADHFAKTLKCNPNIIRWLNWLMAAIFVSFALSILVTRSH